MKPYTHSKQRNPREGKTGGLYFVKHVKKKSMRVIGMSMALALLALSVAGCAQTKETMAEADSRILVTAEQPQVGSLHIETGFIGAIEPGDQVSVFPKLAGTVQQVHVSVGETVQKGQLLFELDPADVLEGLSTAEAAYSLTRASVNQQLGSGMDSAIQQAEIALDGAQDRLSDARRNIRDHNDTQFNALLKYEKDRDDAKAKLDSAELALEGLKNSGAPQTDIDKQEAEVEKLNQKYDIAAEACFQYEQSMDDDAQLRGLRATYRQMQNNYDSALATYNLTIDQAKIEKTDVAMAQLAQAETAYQNALSNLDKTKVYAPITGVIEARNVEPQSLVSQQSSTFTISNKESMQVSFNVSADAVNGISVDDTVTVENGSALHEATIIEVGSMADPQSGLFKVKAKFKEVTPDLLTGLSVKITVSTAKTNDALLIPLSAVYYDRGQPYVYVFKDGVAVRTEFEPGLSDSTYIEVKSGLDLNSLFITSWNPNLTDGIEVRLDPATQVPPVSESEPETEESESESEQENPESEGDQEEPAV